MKVRFAIAPGAARGLDDLEEMADAVEKSVFDGIWLSDVPLAQMVDPLVGLAFFSSRTTRAKLGANVVPLGRNPFTLAKALSQLDILSGGRVLLAFVPGIGQAAEREALGVSGSDRGELLEETLGLARRWWAGETVSYHSSRWSFTDISSGSRPLQDPLEVWLGGHGPRALERVGRAGDGWLGAAVTPEEAPRCRKRIEDAAAEMGRMIDPEHFGMSITYARSEPDPALLAGLRSRRKGVDPFDLVPSGADSLRSMLCGYLEGGISKFVLRPIRREEPWAAELDWLSEAVGDLQS